MLSRYQIVRGKRPPELPLPQGVRLDVRKHTHSVLSPEPALVVRFLADPTAAGFREFAAAYRELLAARFLERRHEFDALAASARSADVHIGCSCPTKANPDVRHCHTVLALRFMKANYPKLRVVMPV
jgi:hypothetical protein